jgi:phenylacetate-CoA ligase
MFPKNFNSYKFPNWMNTGGSTGQPLLFPMNENLESLHQLALYNLMGKRNNDIVVSVDGSRVDSQALEKNIFWTYNESNIIYGKTHFSVLYMNDETLPYYLSHLENLAPSIIRGYPSGLMRIASFIADRSINLNFKLKGIYLTSEFFDNSIVNFLKRVFECPVYGQYGHAEASVFGFTYSNSLEYYCSPLYGYTEVLNEEGKHVDVDQIGEIVVTGFYNKCMPFIRYKTGDLAIYSGNVNGFVKLKSLQGRTIDYLINSNGEKIFLVGLIFGGHLNCFQNIRSWQIEQNIVGQINIYVVKDLKYNDSDENEISTLLLSVNINAVFLYVQEVKLARSGKQKFLIQNLKI